MSELKIPIGCKLGHVKVRLGNPYLFLQVQREACLAACRSLNTFLKSPVVMRVGEVGRWIGQGVRLKPRGRDESPDESERARDDLK